MKNAFKSIGNKISNVWQKPVVQAMCDGALDGAAVGAKLGLCVVAPTVIIINCIADMVLERDGGLYDKIRGWRPKQKKNYGVVDIEANEVRT